MKEWKKKFARKDIEKGRNFPNYKLDLKIYPCHSKELFNCSVYPCRAFGKQLVYKLFDELLNIPGS